MLFRSTDKVERTIRKWQRGYERDDGTCSACAQFRHDRWAKIHEMRLIERKPRSQARCDFEPRLRARDQGAHERPGVEALRLDEASVCPQRIVELAVHFEQGRTAASMRLHGIHYA